MSNECECVGLCGRSEALVSDAELEEEPLVVRVTTRPPTDQYESSISDLETQFGAFHPELGEQLSGLADAYATTGRLSDAASALARAMQITRVNAGLHDPSQRDLLDRSITINRDLKRWEKVDDLNVYKSWLTRRNPELPASDRVKAFHDVAAWHMDAYDSVITEIPFRELERAAFNYELAYEAATSLPSSDAQRADYVMRSLDGIAFANYKMNYAARFFGNIEGSGVSATTFDPSRQREEQEIRNRIVTKSYRAGRKALERAVAETGESEPLRKATRLVLLGDWYQLFGRRHGARKQYEQAYSVLSSAGFAQEEVDLIFEKPVPLPVRFGRDNIEASKERLGLDQPGQEELKSDQATDSGVAVAGPREAPAIASPQTRTETTKAVTASFNVSASGRVRNVKILEQEDAEDRSLRRQAIRLMRRTPFRPRLVAGKPISTQDMQIRFVFPSAEAAGG